MTYGLLVNGGSVIYISKVEKQELEKGKKLIKHTETSGGKFQITLKIKKIKEVIK